MQVKICGITDPADAYYAAEQGADYIGMIFSPQSKRAVNIHMAQTLVSSTLAGGSTPVGVFVNETLEHIIRICDQSGLSHIQMHGIMSRLAAGLLRERYTVFYNCPVNVQGEILEDCPQHCIPLYDGGHGGSGCSFPWNVFKSHHTSFFLAGGLTPDNVQEAIALLKPMGVDVSSGVEFSNKLRKDPAKVKAFIRRAKGLGVLS